ncbi:TetR/AcrR family transcriptional regulator [Streptomyces sp. NPDC048182]|uniref:TetR/AcrR family transcriptional regulator n=1 Tax=Streptomyces sp. NPDC048182 TaxID=3365507 RepID=UPI003719E40D
MPAQPSHNPPAEPLRADARRNRERILDAARETFAARGIDAPMSAVARRAGVGAATLYRHFPTRAALVTAAFAEQLALCAAALDDALADPDPGRGLRVLLEKVCAMQVTDRGFGAAFMAEFPDAFDYEGERDRAEHGLTRLVRRARDTGRLRADFALSDIMLVLLAGTGLAGQPPETALPASRRLLAHLFRSFAPEGAATPLPPPAGLGLRHV